MHDALYMLLTDIVFGASAQQSCEILEGLGARTIPYHFQTGNPFPGIFFGKANHSVDLIYAYDSFHKALRAVDEMEKDDHYPHRVAQFNSNALLVEKLQTLIADFVWANTANATVTPQSQEHLLFLGRDRSMTLTDPDTNTNMQARLKRYQILRRHWTKVHALCNHILHFDTSRMSRTSNPVLN